MNPMYDKLWEYSNAGAEPIPHTPRKDNGPFKQTPKSERKKVGTGTYRNGKEIMMSVATTSK